MNVEKLKRLQAQVRIGGKGTPRRKKKVTHQTAATDDKKLQSSLKKLSVSVIPGIEEVNIIKDDLTVIHFNNPKAQASLSANTFAVTGHGEMKKVVEMLPEILPQLGQETVVQLRMFANSMTTTQNKKQKQSDAALDDFTDDVPLLVEDFDQIAKQESSTDSKLKANIKSKNKSKNVADNKPKDKKESIPDEKPQMTPVPTSNIEESNKDGLEAGTKAQFEEIQPQIVNPNELKGPTQQIIEKQEKAKETNKETIEKSKEIKDAAPKASINDQNKEKENTQALKANKNTPDAKKSRSPTATATKGAPKENTEKDSQQGNKKNQPANANANNNNNNKTVRSADLKNGNIQKHSIVKTGTPAKDKKPKEKASENIKSKDSTSGKAQKDDLAIKTSSSQDDKIGIEKTTSESKAVNEEIKNTNNESIALQQTTVETHHSGETKTTVLEAPIKAPIRDLALPIPPIIPPQPKKKILDSPVLEQKFDVIPLKYEKINEPRTPEASKDTFATIVSGETTKTNLQENIPLAMIMPQADIAVKLTESEKGTKTDQRKSNNDPIKLEEIQPTIEQDKPTSTTESAAEIPTAGKTANVKPTTPSQQKAKGATKQQSNSKSNAPKETASGQQQNQKPALPKETIRQALIKPVADSQNGETAKGKPGPAKPKVDNTNSADKIHSAPQSSKQPIQKTPAAGQTPNKSNEKPAATSKPLQTTTAKTASAAANSKKLGNTASPNASKSQPTTATTENKSKPSNTTPNKPKVPAPQSQQKQSKPRLDASSAPATPKNNKAAQMQAPQTQTPTQAQTPTPNANVNAATPPQATGEQ